MKPYFYIIRHKPSQKLYAGCRYAKNCNPSELLKPNGYKTSSETVKKIIQKDGLESFEIVEIKRFKTGKEVLSYETQFLKEMDIKNNINYLNLSDNSYTNRMKMKSIIEITPKEEVIREYSSEEDKLLSEKIKHLFYKIKKYKNKDYQIKILIYEFLLQNCDAEILKLQKLSSDIVNEKTYYNFFSGILNSSNCSEYMKEKINFS